MLAGSARIDAGAGGIGLSPEQARGSVVDTPTDISRKKPLAIAAAHSSGDGSSGIGIMINGWPRGLWFSALLGDLGLTTTWLRDPRLRL
jgi:hypothetical protein